MIKYKIQTILLNETEKDYIIEYKKTLQKSINSEDFQSSLDLYIKDRNFSVFSLYYLLYDCLSPIHRMDKEDWFEDLYKWAINISFPDKYNLGNDLKYDPLYKFFLKSIQNLSENLEEIRETEFLEEYPLCFLSKEEEKGLDSPEEYLAFKANFKESFIYETMYLDRLITGHNTIDHVVGVNYVSLHIARQLKALGLPVDLGKVVGAGLGHDIGKYGVLEEDQSKVPYFHYYYTEYWFEKFGINDIGHIAANHSTWDLELEALPLESLILIYSDFRVKNQVEDGEYNMTIFSLDESFHIILDKLDNLDEAKENRYKKVYNKLKDFEDYILSLGVDTSLFGELEEKTYKDFVLMNDNEITQHMKYVSIEHNINLMAKLTGNVSFNNILEMARGEENWRKLRLYIEIFKSYSTYLTQRQKITTLNLLSELLFHSGEDIRKESAELIGRLISIYDEEYRKELPSSIVFEEPSISSEDLFNQFLNTLLFPDHKIAYSERKWIYNLKSLVASVFKHSNKDSHNKYFDVLNIYYEDYENLSPFGQFYLSQTINSVPLKNLDNKRKYKLYNYTLHQLESQDPAVKLSILNMINEMLENNKNVVFVASIRNWLNANLEKSKVPAVNYLKHIIARKISLPGDEQALLDMNYHEDENETSDIFLVNLKSATKWIEKKINIDILYDQVLKNPYDKGLHTAMHFCNLLKVSARENVRNYSGKTLINIFPLLSMEERNDVCLELIRALEMESYQFTKFIPYYVGRLILYLGPGELDEILDDFEDNLKVGSIKIKYLLLNTVAVCLENYNFYIKRFDEKEHVHEKRITRLLGLLSISMASYNIDVKNESLRVISSILFDSNILSLKDKFKLFNIIAKKILTFLDYNKKDEYLFYNNAASLNLIYKFLSEYQYEYGLPSSCETDKIAFFPGSFDPFSLSHKNIATEIRDLGFKVFLAVDEFSWSKRTEPHNFRRNIINMSIADEKDIYIFPENIPVNISNQADLDNLKDVFSGKEVYIVVGSDVLINASAYKKESPILDFSHIIFDRKSSISKEDDDLVLENNIANIRSQVIRLSLPAQYEDISSTQIRESIDSNRDISKLIDSLAQAYIYDYGLYLREPQYKSLFSVKNLRVDLFDSISDRLLKELTDAFSHLTNTDYFKLLRTKRNYKLLILRDQTNNEILGYSSFYWIRQHSMYEEFNDPAITEYIRRNVKGRIILISGIYAKDDNEDLIEIVLNEVLTASINRDYNVALYNGCFFKERNSPVEEQLILQGFIDTDLSYNDKPIFLVDMNTPCTLNLDLLSMIKPPYNTDPKIINAVRETRNNLKKVLSNLYPGELLLTYNKDMIYSKLIQKICHANGVSINQSEERVLGPNMCVPFGSILNGKIIPNTVTKTMHTEKTFNSAIDRFKIEEFPFYLPLKEQAKVLKSFNRPVILVDDLLNKGYRINAIEPILRESGIEIDKIIVGILSGRGQEIAISKGIDIDSAYFVPNLKLWFNESSQYPFIGGDMVGEMPRKINSIPSVNMILPYVSPSFIKRTVNQSIYDLSSTCLQNSIDFFKAIEEVYQVRKEKSLTLKNLGEIFTSPRHPDTNEMIFINNNIKPSQAIESDLNYLKRLENIIIRQ